MTLVLFDLDNTLIDRVSLIERWAAARFGHLATDLEAELAWITRTDDDGYAPREVWMAALVARYRLPCSPEELLAEYMSDMPSFVLPEPATQAALSELRKRGHRIGVVTNGLPSQSAKLRAAQLDGLVDGCVVSSDIGVAKPDPEIFHACASRCGVSLAGGWMVGDHPHCDILAAAELGLKTAWIRRGRAWSDRRRAPTVSVDGVPDAVAAILRWHA